MQAGDIGDALSQLERGLYNKNNPAGYMLERVRRLIAAFESKLGEDAEIGMTVSAGSTIRLRSIGASDPDMLIFTGLDDHGAKACLLQHHSQLSLLLVAVPKIEDKPFRIGFV
ncbi:hypothetical protein RPMA_09655 [Tardiphaga alba]|uniref:Uncharacterized protein n=1 Tax=Tardiphaga alba TaxID=340268 RepID=A0ABX8A5V2_9BRAD|nr:hypothetical protein [Tardiphaga alba]QUS39069.1 hypothetical protein RPMA_09655 [Tardiphaga alba]